MCVTFRDPLKSLTVVNNETEMLVKSAINRDFGLGTPKYRESCPAIATPLFRVPREIHAQVNGGQSRADL